MKTIEQISRMSVEERVSYGLANWSFWLSVEYDLDAMSDSDKRRWNKVLRAADLWYSWHRAREVATTVARLKKIENAGDDESARYDDVAMPGFALAVVLTFPE